MAHGDKLAFMYFPGNYRWSHGLGMALTGAPWGGGEIDEVHRTGARLSDRAGDDRACRGVDAHGGARRGHGPRAARRRAPDHESRLPPARGALLSRRRALPAAEERGRPRRVQARHRCVSRRREAHCASTCRARRGTVRGHKPSRAVCPRRAPRRSGVIVNIASIAAKGYPGASNAIYAASKGAVMSMTRIAALSDGNLKSRATAEGVSVEDMRRRRDAAIPIGRANDREDVAALAVFSRHPERLTSRVSPSNVDGDVILD